MRENRTYGLEGGEARAFPTPIVVVCAKSVSPVAETNSVYLPLRERMPRRRTAQREINHVGLKRRPRRWL